MYSLANYHVVFCGGGNLFHVSVDFVVERKRFRAIGHRVFGRGKIVTFRDRNYHMNIRDLINNDRVRIRHDKRFDFDQRSGDLRHVVATGVLRGGVCALVGNRFAANGADRRNYYLGIYVRDRHYGIKSDSFLNIQVRYPCQRMKINSREEISRSVTRVGTITPREATLVNVTVERLRNGIVNYGICEVGPLTYDATARSSGFRVPREVAKSDRLAISLRLINVHLTNVLRNCNDHGHMQARGINGLHRLDLYYNRTGRNGRHAGGHARFGDGFSRGRFCLIGAVVGDRFPTQEWEGGVGMDGGRNVFLGGVFLGDRFSLLFLDLAGRAAGSALPTGLASGSFTGNFSCHGRGSFVGTEGTIAAWY